MPNNFSFILYFQFVCLDFICLSGNLVILTLPGLSVFYMTNIFYILQLVFTFLEE
jgi:hypothetical protein